MERIKNMPLPVLPTFVGAMTLGNVYAGLGFPLIRHITMIVATVVWIAYVVKIVCYKDVCLNEYKQTVPASLYGGFFMMLMLLGSYYYAYVPMVGLAMWFAAWICHAVHIVVFLFRNVVMKRDINTFLPSWFVTCNGIMVSCVVGAGYGFNNILKFIVYWGILIYIILIPIMVWRLAKIEVKPAVFHTQAIVLAPCSLCLVSYLNVIENPSPYIAYFLYICVLLSLAFIILKIPKFFAFNFVPGYAGITFPMAIGIVASGKMAGFLNGHAQEALGGYVSQIQGIQIYLTTIMVGYVLIQFLIMFLKEERR